MARYLIQASYTPEAWDALVKNPVDRSQAVSAMLGSVGAKLITFDFAFGTSDVVAIVEAPDNVSAASAAIAVAASGSVKSIATTVLLTPAEAVEALKKAAAIPYVPPGQSA